MLADPTVAKVVFTPPPLVALVIGINTPGLPLHLIAVIRPSRDISISAARSPWDCITALSVAWPQLPATTELSLGLIKEDISDWHIP